MPRIHRSPRDASSPAGHAAAAAAIRSRTILGRGLRILRPLVLAWGMFVVLGCSLQDRLIFPAPSLPAAGAPRAAPPHVEVAWFEVDPGVRVEAWFTLGTGRSASSPGPAVMVFHGNGELIDHGEFDVDLYRRLGVSILRCEYRGYGASGGRPSQAGIARDMIAMRDWLDGRPEVDPRRVLYHGRSLGGGVAADLARARPPAGLVLTSTFTSLRSMFARMLVPTFLCRHPFDSLVALERLGSSVPILIVHGDADPVVPVSHGRRLAAALPWAEYLELPGEAHVLPLVSDDYRRPIRAFAVRALRLDVTATAPPGTPAESGAGPSGW